MRLGYLIVFLFTPLAVPPPFLSPTNTVDIVATMPLPRRWKQGIAMPRIVVLLANMATEERTIAKEGAQLTVSSMVAAMLSTSRDARQRRTFLEERISRRPAKQTPHGDACSERGSYQDVSEVVLASTWHRAREGKLAGPVSQIVLSALFLCALLPSETSKWPLHRSHRRTI